MPILLEILVLVLVFIGVTSIFIWWLRKLWIAYKNLQISDTFKKTFEVLSDTDAKMRLINREILRIKVQTANVSFSPLIDTTLRSISLLEDLNEQLEKSKDYENIMKTISTLNSKLSAEQKTAAMQSIRADQYLKQIKDLKDKEARCVEKLEHLEHKEKNKPSFIEDFGKFRCRYLDHLKNYDIFYQNEISGITLCKTRFSIEAYIDDFLVMLKTNRSITLFRNEKSFTSRSFNQKINSILRILELDLHVRQHNYQTSIFFKAGHHIELEDGLEIIL